jgi:hypothetical protein
MAQTESKCAAAAQPPVLRNAVDVIFASATDALGSAFLLWILGGVALEIAGEFAGEMVPSLPPAFAGQVALEAQDSGHHHVWWHAVRGHAFVLFFAIFFAHSLWVGFRDGPEARRGRIHRVLANLRENWFGLLVGNAISAWVGVLILGIAQNFSPWQIWRDWAWALVRPGAEEIGRLIFGAGAPSDVSAWISWYGANRLKLAFWGIYLCGALDDLGVPNFKTLARWAWRKRKCTRLHAVNDGNELTAEAQRRREDGG